MDKKLKPVARPFGLDFLQPVAEAELEQVSGGFSVHTNYISLPSKRFPKGDHG